MEAGGGRAVGEKMDLGFEFYLVLGYNTIGRDIEYGYRKPIKIKETK